MVYDKIKENIKLKGVTEIIQYSIQNKIVTVLGEYHVDTVTKKYYNEFSETIVHSLFKYSENLIEQHKKKDKKITFLFEVHPDIINDEKEMKKVVSFNIQKLYDSLYSLKQKEDYFPYFSMKGFDVRRTAFLSNVDQEILYSKNYFEMLSKYDKNTLIKRYIQQLDINVQNSINNIHSTLTNVKLLNKLDKLYREIFVSINKVFNFINEYWEGNDINSDSVKKAILIQLKEMWAKYTDCNLIRIIYEETLNGNDVVVLVGLSHLKNIKKELENEIELYIDYNVDKHVNLKGSHIIKNE